MGEARRRKLAGTYPVQDGGPWSRKVVLPPSKMGRAARADFDRLVLDQLDRPEVVGPLGDYVREDPEFIEKARRLIVWLAERGCVDLWYRDRGRGVVERRLQPSLPEGFTPPG